MLNQEVHRHLMSLLLDLYLIEVLYSQLRHKGKSKSTLLLSEVVFGTLSRKVAYPVQDESHWVDGDGNILPDAILVPEGTTAKGLAYEVHSDLGDGFIRAVDARKSMVIGADYEVQDGDVISIYAKT